MDFALRQVGRATVMAFAGRVNLEGEASAELKRGIAGLIADGNVHVVLDLGNVGFVDSQGLGALISGLKALRQANGSMVLAGASEPVHAVLRVTRLVRVFDVQPDVEAALRAHHGEPAAARG